MDQAEVAKMQRSLLRVVADSSDDPHTREMARTILEGRPWPTEAQEEAERQFDKLLRDYLLNGKSGSARKFRFGGVPNLCYAIEKACKSIAEETGCEDWNKAAQAFKSIEEAVDLRYGQ